MRTSLKNRLVLALAAVILLPVFLTPVWTIRLVAPQYPEGMGMYIGVSEVWGHEEHDIQNINILNHYIGMQAIDPEGIPELDIFPPILAGIIILGLFAAAIGRRWAMTSWLVLFAGLAIAGVVDFYLWMIDYGHNLDPMAAIKIPGMTYTPPLIGTKQLLNISASSWPHIGSAFLGLSFALGAWAVIGSYRKPASNGAARPPKAPAGTMSRRPRRDRRALAAAPLLAFALLATGCLGTDAAPSTAPADPAGDRIVYGASEDPYCGGLVDRVRWGGEIVTRDGERLRFQSAECMAAFLLEERVPPASVASVMVVDFPSAWGLIPVQEATFLHTPNLASPASRGLNVMGIASDKLAESLQRAYTGPLLTWDEVLQVVAAEWQIGPLAANN